MKCNEKEYCMKRAAELREQMIEATKANNRVAFDVAYIKAQRYMTRTELHDMMVMFITHMDN